MLFLDTELQTTVEEAGGWKAAKSGEAGLAAAITVDSSGRVRIYDAATIEDLAVEVEDADTVVTFNGTGFDLPLIAAVAGRSVRPRCHIDLLSVVTRGIKEKGWTLDEICQRTLGYGKSKRGAMAPALAKAGRWGELFDYCLQDVYLTKELYEFIKANGFVVAPGGGQLCAFIPPREADGV